MDSRPCGVSTGGGDGSGIAERSSLFICGRVLPNLNALAAYVATNTRLDLGSFCKINRTLAIDRIKRQIGRWLLAATVTTRRLKPILEGIAVNLQTFVPNRSQPRTSQSKPHLSHVCK
ncbi:MAG: hypothetical protein FAZ92_03748 [Accumulibacter sp.]|uniref:hypothetical protein n=1 Tax=Accumulibacter sp. TaxID=2053492 RepID=UPI0012115E03|nr:hypothetical protein [Accumulibacter sp.]TLD43975.1 MAG: hypothetical protein FAZ92_03748 [Accumulibacter sp.]